MYRTKWKDKHHFVLASGTRKLMVHGGEKKDAKVKSARKTPPFWFFYGKQNSEEMVKT